MYRTVYLLQRDLAKNVEVGTIQRSAKHPVNPLVIGVEESLGGNSVCNEPDTQEKQEEEDILHLFKKKRERAKDLRLNLLFRRLLLLARAQVKVMILFWSPFFPQ